MKDLLAAESTSFGEKEKWPVGQRVVQAGERTG